MRLNGRCFTWNNGGFAASGGKLTVNIANDGRTHHLARQRPRRHRRNDDPQFPFRPVRSRDPERPRSQRRRAGRSRSTTIRTPAATSPRFPARSATRSAAQSLTKTGLGTLYMKGGTSNTYTGLTTIAGGTVVLAKTGGAVAIAGNILMSEPGDGNSTLLQLNGRQRNRFHQRRHLLHARGLFALGLERTLADLGGHQQRSLGLHRRAARTTPA